MAVRALTSEDLQRIQPISPPQPERQGTETCTAPPEAARAQPPVASDSPPHRGGVRKLSSEELGHVEHERGTGEKLTTSAGCGFLRGGNVLGLPADLANKAAIAAGDPAADRARVCADAMRPCS